MISNGIVWIISGAMARVSDIICDLQEGKRGGPAECCISVG
jgi:hypothetical protein